METRFRDRADAGRRLGARLIRSDWVDPIVLGLARGGVVVAAEVARTLGAQLDVVVARKVGAPANPEYGIGAVGPSGARHFDRDMVDRLGIGESELEDLAVREAQEVDRRTAAYRAGRPSPNLAGRDVILVDDGLATGVTAAAVASAIRVLGPRRLVLATPVCSPSAERRLRQSVDDVVCLCSPEGFRSVGEWFEDFTQTTDEEVQGLLVHDRRGYVA